MTFILEAKSIIQIRQMLPTEMLENNIEMTEEITTDEVDVGDQIINSELKIVSLLDQVILESLRAQRLSVISDRRERRRLRKSSQSEIGKKARVRKVPPQGMSWPCVTFNVTQQCSIFLLTQHISYMMKLLMAFEGFR